MLTRILIMAIGLGLAGCVPIEVTENFKIGRHIQGKGYGFRVCRPAIGQMRNFVRGMCGDALFRMKWRGTGTCLVYPNYLAEGPPYLSLCFGPSWDLVKIYPLRRPPPAEKPAPSSLVAVVEETKTPKAAFAPYDPCGFGDECGPKMDCAGQEAGLKFCTPKCRSDADCSQGTCLLNLSQSGDPDHCVLTCEKNQIGQYGCMTNGVCASIGEDVGVGFCVHPDAIQP